MVRNYNGNSFFLKGADKLLKLFPTLGIKGGGRLVEQEDFDILCKEKRNGKPSLLPAGESERG